MGDVRGLSNAPQAPAWAWSSTPNTAPTLSEGGAVGGGIQTGMPPQTDAGAALTNSLPATGLFAGALGGGGVGNTAMLDAMGLRSPETAQQAALEGDASLAVSDGGPPCGTSLVFERLKDHLAQSTFGELELAGTSSRSGVRGLRASLLERRLGADRSLSMDDLLGMADDADAIATTLDTSATERGRIGRALRRSPLERIAVNVREDVLSRISDARQQIETLSQDPQELRVHLGHIAASSASTQELARSLEGLGVDESVRMDTAITLQSLHRDPQRLALFMAGEDVGLEPVVGRLQSALPNALRALDRMEADLKRPDFDTNELLHRPEFGASRERVLRATVSPGRRRSIQNQLRTLQREERRSQLVTGAGMDQQINAAEASTSTTGTSSRGKQAWDLGSIVINTVRDANRVRHASDYVNHGLAERNYEDRAAANFALNRLHEGIGLAHPAAGAAVDAIRIAETFVP